MSLSIPPDNLSYFEQFEATFGLGTVVEVYIRQVIPPSQVITTFTDGYSGRLSVSDLSRSLPVSEHIYETMRVGQLLRCVVIAINHEYKTVSLSVRHLPKTQEERLNWEKIQINDEFKIDLFQELNNHFLIRTIGGKYGLLPKTSDNLVNREVVVRVRSKLDRADLLIFLSAATEIDIPSVSGEVQKEDFSAIEDDLRTFEAFSASLLFQNASTTEVELIKAGLTRDPMIFSNEVYLTQPLLVEFQSNSQAFEIGLRRKALEILLPGRVLDAANEIELLDLLAAETFWFKLNKYEKDSGQDRETFVDITLFNEAINIFISVQNPIGNEEPRFLIKNLNFGHDWAGTSERKKKFARNGAMLFSGRVIFAAPTSSFPFGFSQKDSLSHLLLKSDCHFMVYKLKKASGEILRQEGRTLGIIDKFLEYQLSLLDQNKEAVAFIDKCKQVPSETAQVALYFDQPLAEDTPDLDGDPIVNIKVSQRSLKDGLDEELIPVGEGILKQSGQGYKLSFLRDVDLSLLKDGFYLEKRISKRQLTIQREIIKDFLEKKIKIDHIETLLIKPELTKTPRMARIKFFNPDLKRGAEERSDNNQIRAVKKAVGNENIFLIQGPPGTGKTTVIAEIIDQLTVLGHKILVAGQNHVAVDNVLEKIAKNTSLALLRVGNPDKVDPDLIRYCSEQIASDYQTDLKQFIQNQGILTEYYLELTAAGLTPDALAGQYQKKVNELTAGYGRLQERYRNKHAELRKALTELDQDTIRASVTTLSSWSENIQSEYEVLLQPLIYNTVDVVFATCIGIKTDQMFRQLRKKFDTVIIDEAGKANIAESIVAMELGKKVILVGDQMQLPPYIDGSLIDPRNPGSFQNSEFGQGYELNEIQHALKTSFFEFIINRVNKGEFPSQNLELLNYQHRMHPHIGEFVSQSFYDGRVQMGADTHLNRLALDSPLDKEIVFFDSSNMTDRFEKTESLSFRNDCEARIISDQILPLLFSNQVEAESIAIIAPYKMQVANIKQAITKSSQAGYQQIDVSTLDSFQGKEYDVIIFSFTRSSDHNKAPVVDGLPKYRKVGFLDDARRLNVAFSRAKKKLILVGDAVFLKDGRSHFDGLFNYSRLFQKLVQLSHDERIGRFVNVANLRKAPRPILPPLENGTILPGTIGKPAIASSNGKTYGKHVQLSDRLAVAPYRIETTVVNEYIGRYIEGQKVQAMVIGQGYQGQALVHLLPPSWAELKVFLDEKKSVSATYVRRISGGILVKAHGGIQGMIIDRDIPRSFRPESLGSFHVQVKSFDYPNRKIKFKFINE